MISHLGPGSQVPAWVEDLDRLCFQEAWGPLDDHEHLWAENPRGFARWRVVPEIGEAELLRIAVDPALRRSGHGRDLLRHCQERLSRMGIATLHLEVRVSNASARRFYEGEGWKEGGLRKGYYRDGEDAALYARELKAP